MTFFFNKNLQNKHSFYTNFKKYYGLGGYSLCHIKSTAGIIGHISIILLISKKKLIVTQVIKNIFPLIANKLNFFIWMNKKRLIFVNSFKGFRHLLKLPVNGQRTKTNARTNKFSN